MDTIKFFLGAIAGFLIGFLVPAFAAASLIGLLVTLFNGPDVGEISSSILGQLASVGVSAFFVGLFSFIWSKIDDSSHFGEGCVKGALTGLCMVVICFLILTLTGGYKNFLP